jgi:hypothetical protein
MFFKLAWITFAFYIGMGHTATRSCLARSNARSSRNPHERSEIRHLILGLFGLCLLCWRGEYFSLQLGRNCRSR